MQNFIETFYPSHLPTVLVVTIQLFVPFSFFLLAILGNNVFVRLYKSNLLPSTYLPKFGRYIHKVINLRNLEFTSQYNFETD